MSSDWLSRGVKTLFAAGVLAYFDRIKVVMKTMTVMWRGHVCFFSSQSLSSLCLPLSASTPCLPAHVFNITQSGWVEKGGGSEEQGGEMAVYI